MKEYLNKIRKPLSVPASERVLYPVLILLAGIALGIIAKMLDETASNTLPPFLEALDLSNFLSRMAFWMFCGVCIAIFAKTPLRAALHTFLFFAGMVSSYYVYTFLFASFFPKAYIMIWIDMTVLSPVFGALCWYARGTHPASLALAAMILMLMTRQAFAFGFWYLDVRYAPELLLWVLTIAVLYRTPKQILTVCGVGMLLFFITSPLNLFWGLL